jgi:hypothetical protein
MMAQQQTTSKQADNWAPIILGAVLGLIFSGMLTAGISGWQVYRAAVTDQQTTVPPAGFTGGTYATPAAATAGPYAAFASPYGVPGAAYPTNGAAAASNTAGTAPASVPSPATNGYGTPYSTGHPSPPTNNGTYQSGSTSPQPTPQPLTKSQGLPYPAEEAEEDPTESSDD